MGKLINWELCKRLKFGFADEWFMHKPESVPENEIHKILLDFEIQIHHLIPTKMPGFVLINKRWRTCHVLDFAILAA